MLALLPQISLLAHFGKVGAWFQTPLAKFHIMKNAQFCALSIQVPRTCSRDWPRGCRNARKFCTLPNFQLVSCCMGTVSAAWSTFENFLIFCIFFWGRGWGGGGVSIHAYCSNHSFTCWCADMPCLETGPGYNTKSPARPTLRSPPR